ncbi:MAG: sugar phosphate isomerase/epimerase family protein [Gaiellales bacterium]
MIRLACTDNTFRLVQPWEAALEIIRLLGVPAVDVCIMGDRSHLRPEEVRQDAGAVATRILAALAASDLVVSDVFAIPWTDFETLAPNHPDEAERRRSRELFVDLVDLCARIGSPGLTILPGIRWGDETAEDSFDRAVEELSWRAELARARDVAFSVEPHLGSLLQDPTEAVRLCEAAAGVRLTVDYSHFVYQGCADSDIEPLVAHARHFHARGARRGRLQSALQESTVDFERMLGVMRRVGYDGDVSLEYLWIDWEHLNECDTLSETILLRDRLLAGLAGEPWSYPASPI